MKYIKLFEGFDEEEHLLDIIGELSDSRPKMEVLPSNVWDRIAHDNIILLHINDIFNPDKLELEAAISRLESIGYKILNISADMSLNTLENGCNSWYVSIVRIDFYNKLLNLDISLWKDLKFENWHLNKAIVVDAKHVILNLSEDGEDRISIIDGPTSTIVEDRIEFNIQGIDGYEEMYFYDHCQAEISLIYLQMKYYNLK